MIRPGNLLALVLGAAAGVACSLPPVRTADWMHSPDVAMPVRWVRVQGAPQFEVRDGVCVVYLADHPMAEHMEAAESLLQGCWRSGQTRPDAGGPDTLLLHWWAVDNKLEVARRFADLYPGPALGQGMVGFFWRRDSKSPQVTHLCGVVTVRDRAVVGHELKHCFDGHFHRASNVDPWRNIGRAR